MAVVVEEGGCMSAKGGWLRNRGTTPSSPLGSPARSLLYAVLVPSDPGSLVCPMSREKGEEVEWEREQQIERDTDKERELEEVWATVQPIWDALHRQPVPEVTDKADLIFVECLKSAWKRKNSAVRLERDKISNVYSDVLSRSGNRMQKKSSPPRLHVSHNLPPKSLCDLVIHIYNPSWTLCSSDRGTPPATPRTELLSVGDKVFRCCSSSAREKALLASIRIYF
ncbi:hypothetical protein PAMA_000125 [Pampus argenteus]